MREDAPLVRTEENVIVGAGPAGIAAAVQLKRHGVTPLVFERDSVGGLLRNAWRVENYPGITGGPSGGELAGLLSAHLAASGITPVLEEVVSLDRVNGVFLLTTGSREVRSRTAIIASGTLPRALAGVTVSSGVSDRVLREVCSLGDVSGSVVAVVGAGDAAFDYALSLRRSNEVVILAKGDSPRCLPFLHRRAVETGVEIRWDTTVLSVSAGSDRALEITCRSEDGEEPVEADFAVFAIGREPNVGFLTERLCEEESSLVSAGDLAFAGDVSSGIYRQTAIACGEGVRAAMRVAERLAGAGLERIGETTR
jgi:thioredoxin reductase (NADPH)